VRSLLSWRSLLFITMSIFIWTCSSEPQEEVLKSYPDGEPQEVARYEGQGKERKLALKTGYYRNGAKSFEEVYEEGVISSRVGWWPDGALKEERTYEGGNLVAETTYDTDGYKHITQQEIQDIVARLKDYEGAPADPEDTVTLETSAGTIRLRLFTDVAPIHCDNFKRLANFGFYNGATFHRVVPGFVIQGGDLNSRDARRANDGTGDPGYNIPAEFNPRPHVQGTLAMARSGDPNSAGSQFYIALGRLPQLDNQYTVFGEVIAGLDVVFTIANAPTDSRDNPIKPQRILKARVGLAE